MKNRNLDELHQVDANVLHENFNVAAVHFPCSKLDKLFEHFSQM